CQVDRGINACLGESEIGVTHYKRRIAKKIAMHSVDLMTHNYFIDKTLLIKDVLDDGAKISLITRPRRFGKTLNMSMIQRFFEKTEESNAYLFNGLKISASGEEYLKHQGQYPVISVSLKSLKQDTYKETMDSYRFLTNSEFRRHRKILESDLISDEDKELYRKILSDKSDDSIYKYSLKFLSDCLETVYRKKVIILIDEYDVPLENAYFKGFYEDMISLIRSVFESALKTNPSLEFAVLTGCLRISKESIFTGLNNLRVYPVTENKYSEYFGFTQAEVEELAEYYNLTDRLEEMKKWYNGYLFGKTEIYNSWSIVNYISSANAGNDISCQRFWINTSSNSIIHQLIEKSDENTKEKIENLIAGGSVRAVINENTVYSDIDVNREIIWSFLLFTGYLKQINTEFTNNRIVSEMVIPNLEVLTVYEDTIQNWFEESVRREGTETLLKAMLDEKPDEVENEISKWLQRSISYHDTQENFYHGFLAGLLEGFKRL
ncbi:MAG: AAA family ATPase, partial [Oscillospiraceae bacterium]|nr:AAA family ATPase [Oscillospiraceae bacterium]